MIFLPKALLRMMWFYTNLQLVENFQWLLSGKEEEEEEDAQEYEEGST